MGFFSAVYGWGFQKVPPLPKFCYACPEMMKVGVFIPNWGRSKDMGIM